MVKRTDPIIAIEGLLYDIDFKRASTSPYNLLGFVEKRLDKLLTQLKNDDKYRESNRNYYKKQKVEGGFDERRGDQNLFTGDSDEY